MAGNRKVRSRFTNAAGADAELIERLQQMKLEDPVKSKPPTDRKSVAAQIRKIGREIGRGEVTPMMASKMLRELAQTIGSKSFAMVRHPDSLEIEGNNGGHFIRIERTKEYGMCRIEVGSECVVTVQDETSVTALAHAMASLYREYKSTWNPWPLDKDPGKMKRKSR